MTYARDEDAALEALLERYLEAHERGQPTTIEELCAERPELQPALRELIAIAGEVGDAPADPLLGSRFDDRYALIGRLGAGAMGLVYLARDETLQRTVAIKVLDALAFASRERTERFRREAQALAALADPHIVAVHDLHLDAQPPYLVMEHIAGFDLRALLDGLRTSTPPRWPSPEQVAAHAAELAHSEASVLPELFHRPWAEQIARLGAQACAALAAAHEHGVIHRDVKPSNLMLDASGRLRLLDFGLARRDADASLTRSSASVGTPLYMAPEQIAGEGATASSDLYALGATLYECLCLHPPFQGEGRELENRILYDEPPPPRALGAVPRDLEAICLKALHKAPARRYGDARAMGADLERFLRYEPVSARARILPAPVRALFGAWRRYRPPAAALVAMLALGLAAVIAAGWIIGERLSRTRSQALAEQQQRDRDAARLLRAGLTPTLGLEGTAAERRADPQRAAQMRALSRLLELEPDDVEARFLRACLRTEDGDAAGAAADEARARTQLGERAFESARAAWALLRDRSSHADGPAAAAAAALARIEECSAAVTGAAHRLRARVAITAALQSSRFAEAATAARGLAQADGETAFTVWAQTMGQLGLGRRPAQVLDALAHLDELCPDHLPTLHSLAKYHRDLGRPHEAARYMQRILARPAPPEHLNYWRLHALILRDLRRFDAAEQVIRERFPPQAEDERALALANVTIWRGFAADDPEQRRALMAQAEQQLETLAARATAKDIARLAETNRRLAAIERAGEPVERIRLLLEALRPEPLNELLLVRFADELRNAPRAEVASGCGELLLAQTLIRDPANLRAARALARSLLVHAPHEALEVLRAHLNPQLAGADDRALIAAALDQLAPARRAQWQRWLKDVGLGD
jgi:tRNA A-37 threonylcarbamoyl transferase component Bud32